MIRIFQNDSILNHEVYDNSVIFTNSNEIYKYKKEYIKHNYLITSLNNYANKLLNKYSHYKLVSNKVSIILMWNAFLCVKDKLEKYKNIDDISFSKKLVDTYDFYLENKLADNDKINDLKQIYNKYEILLNDNGYVSKKGLFAFFNSNLDKLEEENYYFENIRECDCYKLEFIKELGKNKNVILFANLECNTKLIDTLSDIEDVAIDKNKPGFKPRLVCCNDLYEEVKFLQEDIIKNINNGINYKDILVVAYDINKYENYFKLIFNFPYKSYDVKKNILLNYISILKKIINGDFSCKTIINLLKLDLNMISEKKLNELDNYIYIWNLEDEPFYNQFTYNPSGKRTLSNRDEKNLEELNDVRLNILNTLKYLISNVIEEKKVSEILRGLYTYLDEEEVSKKIFEYDNYLYNDFVSSLEIINDLKDESNIYEVLDILLLILDSNEKKISMIDEVKLSNLNDYYNNNYKKIYFIGFTEDQLPSKYKFNTLIDENDMDKDTLYQVINKHISLENNLIADVLSNDNVTITYHKLNDQNINVSLSPIISSGDVIYYKYNINKTAKDKLNNEISKDTARRLYGTDLVLSPSSIEVYSKCKYSYFCSYGLNLDKKEKIIFDKREVGTFVHYILENILKNKDVKKEELNIYVDKYCDMYFENQKISNTTRYIINKLKDSTRLVINNIYDELNGSLFKTKYTELKIEDMPLTIKLEDGTLKVKGIVDRVDVYEDDNNFYYRIIDYKTGVKKFRLDDVLEGLNTQMLVYLLAIKNSNISDKKIIPTGFLYYPALIHYKKYSLKEETNIDKIKAELKMNGIINKDTIDLYGKDIINYIDGVSEKKIDENKFVNEEEFNNIFDKVIKVLEKEGNNILEGKIDVNPISNKRCESCEYCLFSSICKFDSKENKYRHIKDYDNRTVLKMIEGDKNGMD